MVVMSRLIAILSVVLLVTGSAGGARAQDEEEKLGSFLTAEVSWVGTAGNSELSTIGFGGTWRYIWTRSVFTLKGNFIRSESTIKTDTAVGTTTSFQVQSTSITATTAENYFLRGRYDWEINKRFFLYGGFDWLRNIFAGIDNRTLVAAGGGNTWMDTKKVLFATFYAATYTFEEDVVENPFTNTKFPGVRLSYDLWWNLTLSTEWNSNFVMDFNLDNTDDVRIDFINSLPVAISSKLALEPKLQILWRNDPALQEVTLFDTSGTDTGETVLVPLESTDYIFTLALVVKI